MKVVPLLGTPLLATTYEEFTEFCRKLVAENQCPWAVDLSNTQVVTMRRHDPDFREITGAFDYFLPDGMPLVWCMNRKGAQLRDRVYGPRFMRWCITQSPAPIVHYFLGGSEDCLHRLEHQILKRNPNVLIAGSHHGYFGREEEVSILQEINSFSPDFIWVGLGTPKQQEWIYRNKMRINRGVLFAVGFAFDVNAGMKPDAPRWMQRAGLTWIFRIASEPRRLLFRYLRYNTLFLFYLLKDTLFGSRISSKIQA